MNQEYQMVVKHPRLYGLQSESMVWGPYLKLMARRPAALKYTGFFKELPSTIQDYFAKCDYTEKKNSLKLLVSMLQAGDMATAEKAFAESCRRAKGRWTVMEAWGNLETKGQHDPIISKVILGEDKHY